ncbi:heavy metal transport/detoxification protein [Salinisphaera shabanensis T35B1]|jgi:copper chaperone|uniref:heavy-metal-associated domain-containing protein n=1 Tax=Salinisphaera TaxID=180541 RepID=UPI0002120E21
MLQLKVTGMSCGHCEKAVETVVADVPGVERVVSVSRADEQVVVDGNPEPSAVADAIRREGYEAQVV